MQIREAVVRNFGPFFGEQTIALGAEERPVTLVYGENMRGKTSLLNALRWAMYGEVRGRTGAVLSTLKLLNSEAARDGVTAFSVDVTIEDEGTTYQVTRQAEAASPPTKDSDFETTLHVRREGNFLNAEEAEQQIRRLLPKEVSHFFLFDGEMLNDFEDLLSDTAHQAQIIKQSIEQILGVPALEHTIEDLQNLLQDAQKKRDRAAQSVRAAEKDAETAQRLSSEIQIIEDDLKELESTVQKTRNDIADIDDDLRAVEGVQAEINNLGELRDKEVEIGARIDGLHERRRHLLASAWKDFLHAAFADRVRELEAQRDRIFSVGQEAAKAQATREVLEGALGHAEPCPTCGRDIGPEEEKRIRAIIAGLPKVEAPDPSEQETVVGSLARLRRMRPANVGVEIMSLEAELSRARVDETKTKNRITELQTSLRDHDLSKVARMQRDRDHLMEYVGELAANIKEANDRLSLKRAEAAQARQRIARISDPQINRLNREVEIYEGLLGIFKAALGRLRDEIKSVIEADASEIFLKLTTDPSYSGLRINDSYGLYILDADKNEVAVRSAGAEQVVALSLIGALNRNAVKRGPMIMDTPFGRLDLTHRANILRFLAGMTDQVVLLVHSGEVDRERDLAVIAESVQREYELQYISSSRTDVIALTGATL